MPRHPDTGRVRRYCIYYNLSGIISQQLSQECKKKFQIPGGLRQKMGDWREKMGVFPSPPPRQRDWNNIKVSPACSKAAGARGQAPVKKREAPQRGEQTGRAIHPVDGSRDRLCDPVGQSTRDIHSAPKRFRLAESQSQPIAASADDRPACRRDRAFEVIGNSKTGGRRVL